MYLVSVWFCFLKRCSVEQSQRKAFSPIYRADSAFLVHNAFFCAFIGESRTFLDEQWLRLGKGVGVVMRKICVPLRLGARRETNSRLRVPPCTRALFGKNRVHRAGGALCIRAPLWCCAPKEYGVLVGAVIYRLCLTVILSIAKLKEVKQWH